MHTARGLVSRRGGKEARSEASGRESLLVNVRRKLRSTGERARACPGPKKRRSFWRDEGGRGDS